MNHPWSVGEPTNVLLRLLSSDPVAPGPLSPSLSRSVVEEAVRHGVAPLLYGRLSGLDGEVLHETAAGELRDVYLHSSLKAAILPGQLRELALRARECGTRLMVLKGARLSQGIYADPAYRPLQDIDLLLPPDGLESFRQALLANGYQEVRNDLDYESMHHDRPLQKAGGLTVELHRRLSRYEEGMAVDLEGIWARARSFQGFGAPLLSMSSQDLLLHLCTHAAYDNRFRVGLLSLCDVDHLVRWKGDPVDWPALVSIANSDGRTPFVYVALRVTETALGTPMPEDILELERGPEEDRLVEAALAYILSRSDDAPVGIQRLEELTGTYHKAKTIFSAVFPSPSRMRRIYSLRRGSPWILGYYLIRPLDLLLRRGGPVLRMALGVGKGRTMKEREKRRRLFNRWTHRPSSE